MILQPPELSLSYFKTAKSTYSEIVRQEYSQKFVLGTQQVRYRESRMYYNQIWNARVSINIKVITKNELQKCLKSLSFSYIIKDFFPEKIGDL